MIVFIAGVHGAGKTTLINNLNFDIPVVKITNLDMSKKVLLSAPCASNQFLRHFLYSSTIKKLLELPPDFLILVDRAPECLNVYDKALNRMGVFDGVVLTELQEDYDMLYREFLIDKFRSGHKTISLYINVPYDILIDNIKNRNRDKKLRESDEDYINIVKQEYSNCSFDYVLKSDSKDKKCFYKEIYKQAREIICESK